MNEMHYTNKVHVIIRCLVEDQEYKHDEILSSSKNKLKAKVIELK